MRKASVHNRMSEKSPDYCFEAWKNDSFGSQERLLKLTNLLHGCLEGARLTAVLCHSGKSMPLLYPDSRDNILQRDGGSDIEAFWIRLKNFWRTPKIKKFLNISFKVQDDGVYSISAQHRWKAHFSQITNSFDNFVQREQIDHHQLILHFYNFNQMSKSDPNVSNFDKLLYISTYNRCFLNFLTFS